MKTTTETITWHLDPKDKPKSGKVCLIFKISGMYEFACWTGKVWKSTGDNWEFSGDYIKRWAYAPKGLF